MKIHYSIEIEIETVFQKLSIHSNQQFLLFIEFNFMYSQMYDIIWIGVALDRNG